MNCQCCPNSYHAYCLTPPLASLPLLDNGSVGGWTCPKCSCAKPKNKVEKILSWRWIEINYPEPIAYEDLLKEDEKENEIDMNRRYRLMLLPPERMPPKREREFFVKWKYQSYWHCEWVSCFLIYF